MTTLAQRGSGTPVTNGTTWATVTNAVDGAVGSNPATYATWTNSTSGATGYIEISGYSFATVPADATLNSVTVSIRTLVGNTGRITSLQYQPYDGATPIGTIQAATMTTTAHNDQATFPVTKAQLQSANFKIRINAVHAANTQSLVLSVDYADVTADYTSPLKAGTATLSHAWAPAAVGKKTPKALAQVTWVDINAAAGKRTPKATATTTWANACSAAGTAPAVSGGFGSPERMLPLDYAPFGQNTADFTLGSSFLVNTTGRITHIRYNNGVAGQTHNVGLWTMDGVLRASATDTAAPAGWREVPLPTPYPVLAGVSYMASFSSGGATGTYTYSSTTPASATPNMTGPNGWYSAGQDNFPLTPANDGTYFYNYLVDVVYQAATASVVYSDDFNRSDGALTGNWEHLGWQINANTAIRDGASSDFARFTADLGTPDHWVEVDVPAVTGGAFMVVNARGSGALGANCYMGFLHGIAPFRACLGKQVNYSYSDIVQGPDQSLDAYKARLEVQGDQLRLYRNDVLVQSASDTSLTTGNLVGINTNDGSFGYDNFRCGPLPYVPVGGGPAIPTGTALTTWSATPAAVGQRTPKSTATVSYTEATAAVGKKFTNGAANTTWSEATAAAGKRTPKATASTNYTEVVTAVGKRTPKATATVSNTWVCICFSTRPTYGSATVTWSNVTTSLGYRAPKGIAGTGNYNEAVTAVGKRVPKGTAAALAWAEAVTAAGKRVPKGTAGTGNYTDAVAASGKRDPKGIATTISNTWIPVAAGAMPVLGAKQGDALIVNVWSPAAVGYRAPKASASTIDAWMVTAVGKRIQRSNPTTTWTTAPAAVGKRAPKAAANVATTYVPAAVGKRTPKAAGTTTWTYVQFAQGVTPIAGVKQGSAIVYAPWATAAVGKRKAEGGCATTHTWVVSARGIKVLRGAAATAHTWQPSAVGRRTAVSSAAVSYLVTAAAVGRRTPKSTVDVNVSFDVFAGGLTGVAAIFEGLYNGYAFDAMQYGDKAVVDWLLVPS